MDKRLQARNKKTLVISLGVVIAMGGLAYASVPLYKLFCQVTGYGGTTQVADAESGVIIGNREITVRFNADTDPHLPWQFKPTQHDVKVKVGQSQLVYYTAKNTSEKPVIGTAVYNVTPDKAGVYFNKVQCFCFEEQLLQPGQEIEMPVTFFVDPEIVNDHNLDDVKTITLSYTFYQAKNKLTIN